MKNPIQRIALSIALLFALFLLFSCEKTNIETTNVNLSALYQRFDALESLIIVNNGNTEDLEDDIADLKADLAVIIAQGNLNSTDIAMLKAMVTALTNIALNIQSDVADSKDLLINIKDMQISLMNAIQDIGGDVTDVKLQLAQIWIKLFKLDDIQDDLNDIEDAVGGLENLVALLLNNFDNYSQNSLALLLEIRTYVQANNGLLTGIDNQIGIMIGNQILLLQGQANGNAAAAAFYAQTNATLQQQGVSLAQLLSNQAAFQAMYQSDHQAAMALWGQMVNVQLAQGQQLTSLQTSAASLITMGQNQLQVSNDILDAVQALGLNGAQVLTIVQGIPNLIQTLGTNVQSSLNAWGQAILADLGNLGLDVHQQGLLTGQIWGVVQNIPGFQIQMLNAIASLNLSIADLEIFFQAEIQGVKDEITDVQISLAQLHVKVDALTLQAGTLHDDHLLFLAMLADLGDNFCCPSCNGGNPSNITTSITNVYNNYIDNSVNQNLSLQQIYNFNSNVVGSCPTTPTANPPFQVCPVINLAMPVIQGNQNNTQFNWGVLGNNASTISQNWGC